MCLWPLINRTCLLHIFCMLGCRHYFQLFYCIRFIIARLDNKTSRDSIVVGALLFLWDLKQGFHSLVCATLSSSPVLLLPVGLALQGIIFSLNLQQSIYIESVFVCCVWSQYFDSVEKGTWDSKWTKVKVQIKKKQKQNEKE